MYSFEEIYQAYLECRKNKRNSINALKFELHLLDNLWELHDAINAFKYKPKRYIYFLTHSPKLREVFASDFRDRVAHHLLVRDLEPMFEPIFIYDSYSCRKKRGTHLAIHRLERFVQNQNYPYYLQLDLKSFFLSINKDILFEKIRAVTTGRAKHRLQRVLYLSQMIIFDDPTKHYRFKGSREALKDLPAHKSLFNMPKNKGLAIGNLTSQFFANVYLNDFDNFIKRVLKRKYYMRYVDDFVILGQSKEELFELKEQIAHYLWKALGLQLREQYFLKETKQGIDFLGYVVKPSHTLVRQRVVNNFKQKKAQFLEECFEDGTCSLEDALRFKEINASYFGHIKHADSFRLMKKYGLEDWISRGKS